MPIEKLQPEGIRPQARAVAPLVNTAAVQRGSKASEIANALGRLRPQLSNVFNQRIARDVTEQKRKAALLATANEALPKGYFREAEQVYQETRGAIAGRRAAQQLALKHDEFFTQAQQEGASLEEQQDAYSKRVDEFIATKFQNNGSQDFGIGQLSAFDKARTDADNFFLSKADGLIKAERQTTMKGALDVFIDNAAETGKHLDLDDYHNFRTLAKAIGVPRDEANKLYAEHIAAIAISTGDYKMLDHVFEVDPKNSGFKLSEDSVVGNTLVQARATAISKFLSVEKARDAKLKAIRKEKQDKMYSDLATTIIQNPNEDMSNVIATTTTLSGANKLALHNFSISLQKESVNFVESADTLVAFYAQVEDTENPLRIKDVVHATSTRQINANTAKDLIAKITSRGQRGEQPSAYKAARGRIKTMYGDPASYLGVNRKALEAKNSKALFELDQFNLKWQREHPNLSQDSEEAQVAYIEEKDRILKKYFVPTKSEDTYYSDEVDEKIRKNYYQRKFGK